MAHDASVAHELSRAMEGLTLQSNAVPQLPTELIHRIIKLALPIVSYSTYKERYQLLLAFSLVNSTWSALARQELYKEVFVKTGEKLVAVLEGRESQLGRRVHLAGRSRATLLDLPAPALQGVKYLSVYSMEIHAESWPPLEASPPSGCLFASLTTLSLVDVYVCPPFPTWTNWLTPTNLPKLRSLTMCMLSPPFSFGADGDLVGALGRLAPRLQYFTFAEGVQISGIRNSIPWSAFTTILHLALYAEVNIVALLGVALAQLPAPLSHLQIGHGISSTVDVHASAVWMELAPGILEVLKSESGCLTDLRVLVLHFADAFDRSDTWDETEQLNLAMTERGGLLVRRAGWGEQVGQLWWERFLEVW